MATDLNQILGESFKRVSKEEHLGEVASYIPELAHVDPDRLGTCIYDIHGGHCSFGDANERFSIQSIAKVLSLTMAYSTVGEEIWKRVDVEPSGTAFNSLVQLESDNGIPRNPLINAGALVVCDILCTILKDPKAELLAYIQRIGDCPDLDFSSRVAKSEKETGFRNYALIYYLKSFGNIKNDVERVADLYFHLCSIELSCTEIARVFLFLANGGVIPSNNTRVLSHQQSERINAIMATCGFYDEAGEFAYRVGLPGKSGVGGGIVAIRPDQYAISVWSPKLNPNGNSYRGMKLLEYFTSGTRGSIF